MKYIHALLTALLLVALCLSMSCGTPTPTPGPTPTPTPTPTPQAGVDPFAACETVPSDLERAAVTFGALQIKTAVQNGISEQNGIYTITKGGDYTITGRLDEGQLRIEAAKGEKVKLILTGAYISSSTRAPIVAISADELTVKAEGGTYNVVHDRRAASVILEQDAAVYSKEDLTFSGQGTLIVRSEHGMGAHSTNDIDIKNISLKVCAFDTAIKGNDTVTVESGTLCLISGAEDGIKTSNTDISSKGNQRGTVSIQSGRVDIFSAGDGIQAAYTYQQSESALVTVRTGAYGTYPHGGTAVTAATSAKGIKCEHELLVKGGTLWVLATEDALQANGGIVHENGVTGKGTLHISGGYVRCASEANALHADGDLTVSDAYLVIEALTAEEELVNVAGKTTFATSTAILLGHSTSLPTDTLTVSGLSLTDDTYTLRTEEKSILVFAVHTEQALLHLWSEAGLPDGDYTLASAKGTVISFTVKDNAVLSTAP